jgi:hypothetical protein
MKLRQGSIDCRDCCIWLMLDLKLVDFSWVWQYSFFASRIFAGYQK